MSIQPYYNILITGSNEYYVCPYCEAQYAYIHSNTMDIIVKCVIVCKACKQISYNPFHKKIHSPGEKCTVTCEPEWLNIFLK